MRPRVAVVIPCHDDGELALEAVRSIQEEEPVELVLVDDASTDPATLHALDDLRREGIRVVRHPRNLGLSAARMTGVAETSAPYVFPLDADDLAVPGALATMADLLDADTGAAVCFGDYVEIGARHGMRPVTGSLDPYRVAYNNEWAPSALIRRDVLQAVGGWSFHSAGYEDWDLWMTLAERGVRTVHAGVVIYRYRVGRDRMLSRARRQHRRLYRELRARHPMLFAQLGESRRRSDLPRLRRLLYPVVYFGGRPRLSVLRAALRPLLGRHREDRATPRPGDVDTHADG